MEPTLGTDAAINAIRSAFGLSVTDLAAVFRVERPTVYSWLKLESTPSDANARRLGTILKLADTWRSLSPAGASVDVRAMDSAGRTVLAALSSVDIDLTYVEARIKADLSSRLAMSVSVSDPLDLARSLGLAARPDWEFNVLTGRALGPEIG
jgi:transcriptional regulator with XRE-family HTH domain